MYVVTRTYACIHTKSKLCRYIYISIHLSGQSSFAYHLYTLIFLYRLQMFAKITLLSSKQPSVWQLHDSKENVSYSFTVKIADYISQHRLWTGNKILSLATLSACSTKTNAFFSIQLIYSRSPWQNRTEFSRCKYLQLNFRAFYDAVICILWDFSNLSGDAIHAFSNSNFLP